MIDQAGDAASRPINAAIGPTPSVVRPTSRIPLTIALISTIVVAIQSVILIMVLSSFFAVPEKQTDESTEVLADDGQIEKIEFTTESSYIYDKDNNLSAFNLNCTSDVGMSFIFTGENSFIQQDSLSNLISSGKYYIHENNLIQIIPSSGDERVLYYLNGARVADGLELYTCQEDSQKDDA